MVPGEVPISRVTIDWQQIERAYGESLSADVRKTVFAATEFFLLFEELERTGEPVAHIQTIIEACKRRASEFQQALPSHELGSGVSAMLFIRKNFNDPRLSDRLFGILHGLLTSLGVACNAALKELSEFSSLKEGDEWKSWIRKLTKIMKDAGLPWKVSKDDLRTSRFVALARELQKCLPAECRRHMHSDTALATAIVRARGYGSHKARATVK